MTTRGSLRCAIGCDRVTLIWMAPSPPPTTFSGANIKTPPAIGATAISAATESSMQPTTTSGAPTSASQRREVARDWHKRPFPSRNLARYLQWAR